FMPGSFVPMTPEGPDPLLVREKALTTGARLLYTIPSVHNPTGYRYSPRVKRELCAIARETDLYLIEDDSLSEFFPDPSPRFLDLAPERTFYIKSLAKSTVSANRLGILVPPPPFFNAMLTAKFLTDISTSGLLQRAMVRFIREGLFQAFIDKALPVHRSRRKKLLHLLKEIPLFSVQKSSFGFWLWVRLNKAMDIAAPPWTEGRFFSPSPENRPFFRLAYMNIDDETFSKGLLQLKRMAQTLSL
ncbi:MAG TPA: PLP-dependent aminotransferase family protein, partial [Firmicutes bacterium]|nr:PLP-dependent aminotransferase family protein [Bacillota bacterium]